MKKSPSDVVVKFLTAVWFMNELPFVNFFNSAYSLLRFTAHKLVFELATSFMPIQPALALLVVSIHKDAHGQVRLDDFTIKFDGDKVCEGDFDGFGTGQHKPAQCGNPGTFDLWNNKARFICDGNGNDDELYGTNKNDVFRGFGGDDICTGNGGNDRAWLGGGNDSCTGGGGNDKVWGGGGNDSCIGGGGNDLFKGGGGCDGYYGVGGNDRFVGGNQCDVALMGDGKDKAIGGNDFDFLDVGDGKGDIANGGKGNDIILAGGGSNGVRGGSGADLFGFDADLSDNKGKSARTVVNDFEPGKDVLVFHDLDTTPTVVKPGATTLADLRGTPIAGLSWKMSNGNLVITVGDHTVVLKDTKPADVDLNNLLFSNKFDIRAIDDDFGAAIIVADDEIVAEDIFGNTVNATNNNSSGGSGMYLTLPDHNTVTFIAWETTSFITDGYDLFSA